MKYIVTVEDDKRYTVAGEIIIAGLPLEGFTVLGVIVTMSEKDLPTVAAIDGVLGVEPEGTVHLFEPNPDS